MFKVARVQKNSSVNKITYVWEPLISIVVKVEMI